MPSPDQWLAPFAAVEDERRRIYMAMVAAMDAAIGRILDALQRHGVEEDTLVWFASDNGGQALADNTPLRAGKGTVYEGGTRVAAALRWPNGVPGKGRKVSGLTSYLDVLPTLRRVAGLGASGGPGEPLDGEDVFDLIAGREPDRQRRFFSYYERYGDEQLALIDGDWKVVRRGAPILGPNPADAPPPQLQARQLQTRPVSIELFNLRTDPLEKINLAERESERAQAMIAELKAFRAIRQDGGVPPMTAPTPDGWSAPERWKMAE